jgi:GTP cyclohydrolase I
MNEEQIRQATEMLLEGVGEDKNREGISKTPDRVAKMMGEILSGYQTNFSEFEESIFLDDFSDMVLVKDIEFYSICEHHLVPFFGMAHVAFIPDGKLIGLSKIPRIVDAYAKRLQVQERMTDQIAVCLKDILSPKGVAVSIEANHLCMMMRGIKKQKPKMVTQNFSGVFREDKGYLEQFLMSVGTNLNDNLDTEIDI